MCTRIHGDRPGSRCGTVSCCTESFPAKERLELPNPPGLGAGLSERERERESEREREREREKKRERERERALREGGAGGGGGGLDVKLGLNLEMEGMSHTGMFFQDSRKVRHPQEAPSKSKSTESGSQAGACCSGDCRSAFALVNAGVDIQKFPPRVAWSSLLHTGALTADQKWGTPF